MRVCYINPTFLVRRPIAELIERLDVDEAGLFVPKKLFKGVDSNWHSSFKKAKIYSYSAISLPGNFEWPIPVTPVFFVNLFRVFLRYKVIHMWTYFYINSFFVVLFKLFFPKRKIIMSCDTFPGYSFKSGMDLLFKIYTKLFGRIIFSFPDKVHIYGKSLIKYAKKAGVKEKKIVVIPTGIDLKKFSKGKNIRKDLGVDEKDLVLVYAGLIVPRKGIDVMLKSVKKLDAKLLLVGEGPKKREYIDMAKRLGVDDKVGFFGWRKDIPSVLKSADVLFLPSRGEGLPGIVMEAMASGLAVVTSDVGCTSDLVKDGKNGFLCPVNDVGCFIEKIKKVDKNMGIEGLKKIKKFDWGKLVEKYKEIYT